MTNKNNLEVTKNLLKKHRQAHLLAFWEQLNTTQRQNLLAQIEPLNLAKIDNWVAKYVKKSDFAKISSQSFDLAQSSGLLTEDRLTPAESYSPEPADPAKKRKYDAATKLGKELIRQSKVAAFVVAGGQGTRLGFDGPKGNFPISPVKNKTLFQIFAETITAVSQKYQAVCPWYVMTSPLNHAETVEIFRSNNHYGLKEEDVCIFQQGTLPNFSFDGKILLADKDRIACSPDGHGGSLKALYNSKALEDMKKRGVELISYWQVDNPLIKIFDPLFIGLHVLDKAEMSSKALVKTGPYEKVGNFCLVDGKVNVIEYTDLPDELAEQINPDGSLTFELGSIGIHVISTSFIEQLNKDGFALPLHRAEKTIPYIDQRGNPVKPTEPNGIKLESFVFDALPLASKSIILQTIRSEEFAPVKNAAGVDSVEATRQMMVTRAVDWLESAGVNIPRKADGSVDCLLEIAPGFALEKEDIKAKLNQIPQIKPKDKLYLA